MTKISELAENFDRDLEKVARRQNKKKMSRKQLLKNFDKNKSSYQVERKKLNNLEKDLAKLEADIQSCRDSMKKSRSEMLKMSNVLQSMDLADCNYVYLYENDEQDVAYVIDNDEYHLDIKDSGEFSLVSWKDFLKSKKEDKQEAKDEEVEEFNPQPEPPAVSEDVTDADDFPYHPNLRFID